MPIRDDVGAKVLATKVLGVEERHVVVVVAVVVVVVVCRCPLKGVDRWMACGCEW